MTEIHMKSFCKSGLKLAENEIAVERFAGNIIKEEHWKGEACAYRAILCELEEVAAHPTTSQSAPLQNKCETDWCESCKNGRCLDVKWNGDCAHHI